MWPIILRTIRDRWRMLLAMCLIGVGTMLMYVSLFPTYQDMLEQNQQIMDQMPAAFKEAFNLESLTFDTLEKFLNIEMYSLFWVILTITFVLSLASNALAGEVERETVVQTSGQPVSRLIGYLGKFLAASAMFTAFNVLVNASVLGLAPAFGLTIDAGHLAVVTVMCELFGLGLLGLGFAVSAFLSEKGRVQIILAGIVLVMYVLNIVAGIQPSIENLKYASIFHYFNTYTFLVKGEYDLTSVAVFAGLLVIGLGIGGWRWKERDIA